ncbi:MAG TPA: twin-arginine translocation signal domain-containing protein [Dehalococcoidia bacterium]|nr:twin-arginine translocation signal domain-containing protein [Dehalococcoidia bacterium]
MAQILQRRLSRRGFIAATGVTLAGAAVALANTQCDPAIVRRVRQIELNSHPRHRAYVWEFEQDGPAADIASTLAADGMAAMVKTHDGLDWMAKYDLVPGAIDGPRQVSAIAQIFENAGVPFHAWAVVKGIDPVAEAHMAADVLAAGARSLTLDLEPYDGFWQGTNADAVRFGEELRARQPSARIDISIDPRPWKMLHIPLAEFVRFTDGIQPQLYWDMFADDDNANAYAFMGYPPGPDGVTPEFLVQTTQKLLAPYDRWVVPIGDGAAIDPNTWPRFLNQSRALQMPEVAVWRYGVTPGSVLAYLGANPA